MNTKADRKKRWFWSCWMRLASKATSANAIWPATWARPGLGQFLSQALHPQGFIKISEAPANRYLYYLTPKGFTEKSRLTAKYLFSSFAFYRKAGDSCLDVFQKCEALGWRRILLYGMSDLAEIATLRVQERDVQIVGILDPHAERHRFAGLPVWRNFDQAEPFDVMC
jgi:hypothetical protein